MKRTSRIWLTPQKDLQKILDSSNSFVEVLERLGLQAKNGNNMGTLKKRIIEESFDTSILDENRKKARKKQLAELNFSTRKYSNEELFGKNTKHSNSHLKQRILKENIIEYKCQICGNPGEHFGEPLSLQLDHKNGINNDNRLENLRFLCPNCHTQTDTYSNKKKPKLCRCGKKIHRKSKACRVCNTKTNQQLTKIKWPSPAELQKMLWEKPTATLSKELGVSDVAISKFCKRHGLSKPPRGYWTKLHLD